jgi:hypothetical protein
MSRVYTTSLAIALAYILTVQTDFGLALAWPWGLALGPGLAIALAYILTVQTDVFLTGGTSDFATMMITKTGTSNNTFAGLCQEIWTHYKWWPRPGLGLWKCKHVRPVLRLIVMATCVHSERLTDNQRTTWFIYLVAVNEQTLKLSPIKHTTIIIIAVTWLPGNIE